MTRRGTVLDPDSEADPDNLRRVMRLEARVALLESALARALMRLDALPPADPMAMTQPIPVPDAEPPGGIRAAPDVPPSDVEAPATVPEMRRESPNTLSLTNAFATLDLRLAEAAEAESEALRKRGSLAPMVDIDPDLIDQAFARPPPVKVDVRCALEEKHAGIMKKVSGAWRSKELIDYLRKLIVDERGDRAGFDPEVMSELLLLSSILEAPAMTDAWNANARTI